MRRLGQATEVTIHLSEGTYYLYEPLRLRPEDSGLTIEGEHAVISGGMRITGWKRQGKLLVADVPDFNGRPIDFRQLWVNEQKAVKALDVPAPLPTHQPEWPASHVRQERTASHGYTQEGCRR